MAVGYETKLRWFDIGAGAFERRFPGLLLERFGADVVGSYVCPECDVPYPRSAVDTKELSVEHVPPHGVGGKELLLTCRSCNNRAGKDADVDAINRELVAEAKRSGPEEPMPVLWHHEGYRIAASIVTVDGKMQLKMVEKATDPKAIEALRKGGLIPAGTSLSVEFHRHRFDDMAANASWFRAGFLALTAVCGYRFSCNPAIEIVKSQIRQPDKAVIYCFTTILPPEYIVEFKDWSILDMNNPRCTAVVFGKYAMLYPNADDMTFYDRVRADIESGHPPGTFTAQQYHWAGRDPLFDQPEDATTS